MRVVAGPYAVAALLLIASGALEIRSPDAAGGALAAMGIEVHPIVVRAAGGVAVLVGGLALVVDGDGWVRGVAVAVGLAYVAFSGFVAAARVRDTPLASCGCFGRSDTPPSVTHLVLDLVAVAAAAAVVGSPEGGVAGVVAEQPGSGIGFLLMTAACAFLAYLVFTLLPRVLAAAKP